MKCKIEAHEGIKVTLCEDDSPHYAGAYCRQCGLWLKWLHHDMVNHPITGGLTVMEELHEASEEASEDVRGEGCGVDLSAAMTKAIRVVVRGEISELFKYISNAMK